jgi:hypothetical protein
MKQKMEELIKETIREQKNGCRNAEMKEGVATS